MTTGQRGRPGDPARAVSIPARHMQDSSPLPDPARLSLLDVVQLATLGMRSRPLRAVLSILGVAVGMATLVLVVAIPQSGNAALLAKFTALGSNLLTSKPRHRRCPRGRPVPGSTRSSSSSTPTLRRVIAAGCPRLGFSFLAA